MARPTFVIVGGGLAGAKAAEALRGQGFDGRIALIGEESERPYERPPLSKGYLQGKEDRESVFVHPERWYTEHDVDLLLGSPVTGIDRGGRTVTVAGGDRIGYDKLLLATGATPRPLRVPGADLDGVLYLRRIGDSERIRQVFRTASHVVFAGAGWIGLEAAAACREAGVAATVVEMEELPLLRVLGPRIAPVFADLHRDHGVDLRLGARIAEIVGDGGRVAAVRLEDGTRLDADAVVAGVGVTPAAGLAERAGLDVGDGIVTDASLRTSDPGIFAAGDVAAAHHPVLGRRIRVEHWANALNQPETAARAMLGGRAAHEHLPYFFTDQYDLGMEYAGHAEPGGYDDVVVRGDLATREFVAFWLAGGRVLAGMNVNVWDVTDAIQELVRSGAPVDPARLADPDVPLDRLATG